MVIQSRNLFQTGLVKFRLQNFTLQQFTHKTFVCSLQTKKKEKKFMIFYVKFFHGRLLTRLRTEAIEHKSGPGIIYLKLILYADNDNTF